MVYWGKHKEMYFNKVYKQSKSLMPCFRSVVLFYFVPELIMDPVATYTVYARWCTAISEKLNFTAHHIPFNIQNYPQPGRTYTNRELTHLRTHSWFLNKIESQLSPHRDRAGEQSVPLAPKCHSTPSLLHLGEVHLCQSAPRASVREVQRSEGFCSQRIRCFWSYGI